MLWVAPWAALLAAAGPAPSATALPSTPAAPPELVAPAPTSLEPLLRSPPIPNLGPRLAAKLRASTDPAARLRFVAKGLSTREVEAHGGRVTATFGEIVTGHAPASAFAALAASAAYVDAPQALRPQLDHSRVAIGADRTDFAEDFAKAHRGKGVLIAAYDSGVDLLHPDLRTRDGTSRVAAAWDQDAGPPCARAAIAAGSCAFTDRSGHGTHVASIAASSGPQFRGIAPEAELVIARADLYGDLLGALGWFREVAREEAKPMVVNLSLGGHEGAHDGTSLEAQAIDAYEYLVVAAAGNDGNTPVHALATLTPAAKLLGLKFPGSLPVASAIVELWGEPGSTVEAQVVAISGGVIVARSSTIAEGAPGLTEKLIVQGESLGRVELDAEAGPHPLNEKTHLRIVLELDAFDPAAGVELAISLRGTGTLDAWVDAPASMPQPPVFTPIAIQGLEAITPDSERTISDPSTAKTALSVASYVTRTSIEDQGRDPLQFGGQLDALSGFTARGPSLDPERTGPKPDLAAPGQVIVGALSRDAPEVGTTRVTPLYRAASGTSMAAPHAAGVAALLLELDADADKARLKSLLLDHTQPEGTGDDARWGRGKLDAAAAVAALAGDEGCGCRAQHRNGPGFAAALLLVVAAWCTRKRARG